MLALFTYACSGADIVDPANIMLQLTQRVTSKQLVVLPDRPAADIDCCTTLSTFHTVFVCCISLNDIRTVQQMLAVQLTAAVQELIVCQYDQTLLQDLHSGDQSALATLRQQLAVTSFSRDLGRQLTTLMSVHHSQGRLNVAPTADPLTLHHSSTFTDYDQHRMSKSLPSRLQRQLFNNRTLL